jgi:hypothetical protein
LSSREDTQDLFQIKSPGWKSSPDRTERKRELLGSSGFTRLLPRGSGQIVLLEVNEDDSSEEVSGFSKAGGNLSTNDTEVKVSTNFGGITLQTAIYIAKETNATFINVLFEDREGTALHAEAGGLILTGGNGSQLGCTDVGIETRADANADPGNVDKVEGTVRNVEQDLIQKGRALGRGLGGRRNNNGGNLAASLRRRRGKQNSDSGSNSGESHFV